jgi:hemolysin activation/secretion protein
LVHSAWILLAILSFSSIARAQSRVIDKAESQRAQVVPDSPEAEAPSDETKKEESEKKEPAADYTPFGVDIAAVILHSHQDKADTNPAPGEEKIVIDSAIPAPDGLNSVIEPYIGKPASMGLLADLAKDIITAWRDSDYPIVDVYFPEQNVTKGKIQIVVREAMLGQVVVEGAKHSDPAFLKRNIRLAPGDRVNRRIVETDLDWLNENPIRQVNLIYDRGQADGTADIELQVIEEKPLTAYAGFANTGVPLTGENEWSAGVNWSNPFRTEQSIGYHFGADVDFETLKAHSLFYRGFLPWRHEIRLIGALVQTDVLSGDEILPVNIGGESIQATAEYRMPLPRLGRARNLRHAFTLAADYKSTNTDLLFGGASVFANEVAILQFRAEYDATLRDKLGYTRGRIGSVWSPGDVLANNDDASFDALREGSTADYWYGFAEIERGFKLPAEFQFILRGTGHYTDARLTSTEQLLAGGYLTVRGFDENLVRGDYGGIVNAELISPSFTLIGAAVPAIEDKWNVLAFYDGAFLGVNDALEGEASPSLQSAGLGLTCRINDVAYARAAYGWVLDTQGVPEESIDDGRLHFGITVRY